jgi:hypothetical protein
MPPVPQQCQPLADRVTELEAEDQRLRAELGTLHGADAWQALATLGELRGRLARARQERDRCIETHAAAIRANLVLMDLAEDSGSPGRTAQLWEISEQSATLLEASAVQDGTFAFKGPLPAAFGLSVTTNGVAQVIGPDFRSLALTAADVPAAGARVEVVLVPKVRLDAAVLARVASSFTPSSHTVKIEGGGVSADLSLTAAEASFEPNALAARVVGQATIRSPIGGTQGGPFSASAKLRLVPSAAAATADPFDLTVSDLTVELPGILGSFVAAILPMIRETLSEQLTHHVRPVLRDAIAQSVVEALVLPRLPKDVTVSIRQLAIDADGIMLQPALGALGRSLSTFTPPVIPPP